MRRIGKVALVAVLMVAACGPTPSPGPIGTASPPASVDATATPDALELPTLSPDEAEAPCADLLTPGAVLRGDQANPRLAWLDRQAIGRMELVWPAGYRALFSPELVIVAPEGTIVARDGDTFEHVCVTEAGPVSIPLTEP